MDMGHGYLNYMTRFLEQSQFLSDRACTYHDQYMITLALKAKARSYVSRNLKKAYNVSNLSDLLSKGARGEPPFDLAGSDYDAFSTAVREAMQPS